MNTFMKQLDLEIRRQEKYLSTAKHHIALAPSGSLLARKRKKKTDYYHVTEEKKKVKEGKRIRKQTNINHDQDLILQLVGKLIQKRILRRSQNNLLHLKKLRDHYIPADFNSIFEGLSSSYHHVIEQKKQQNLEQWRNMPYPKASFDSRFHIHETDSGELVRSKSEQIILNTLYTYPLVVHYEEEFLYKIGVPGINRCFPDFTIILPDGSRIIWEHLGRLDDPGYCQRTAAKLNLYQKNGYVIGKNLILTMDDDKGNISSSLVIDAIEHYILPYVK